MLEENRNFTVRNPDATHPWQHVLDCLTGYLVLLDAVHHFGFSGGDFGPATSQILKVSEVLELCQSFIATPI